nr:hypothetical protein [Tanacetum cinerariifolium]
MLWSRVSSSGLLSLEEVVSIPNICNALPRLFLYGVKEKTDPFVQTPGSGISILLAVGTPSTGSGNLYCQWELSPGSGNALIARIVKSFVLLVLSRASHPQHHFGNLVSKSYRLTFFFWHTS